LDLLLRLLQRLVDPGMDDRLVLLEPEPLQHAVEPFRAAEDAHEVVFERQEELGMAGVGLAAGAAAQLVVDAPALVTLGAEHVEPASVERLLLEPGNFGLNVSRFYVDLSGLAFDARKALFQLRRRRQPAGPELVADPGQHPLVAEKAEPIGYRIGRHANQAAVIPVDGWTGKPVAAQGDESCTITERFDPLLCFGVLPRHLCALLGKKRYALFRDCVFFRLPAVPSLVIDPLLDLRLEFGRAPWLDPGIDPGVAFQEIEVLVDPYGQQPGQFGGDFGRNLRAHPRDFLRSLLPALTLEPLLELTIDRLLDLGIDPSLQNVGFEVERTPGLHLIKKPVANSKPHVAAKLNVGAAARHVGGDGDRARHAGLGDDLGLLLVIAGVEDGEHLRLGGALAARIE